MLSEVLPFYADAFDVDLVLVENKISYEVPDAVNIIALDLPIAGGGLLKNAENAIKVILRLRRMTNKCRYAAVVSYLDFYNVMVCVANSFRRNKLKHIAVEQTTDYEFFANSQMAGWKQVIIKRAVGWAYNRVDRVIAVSENLKNFLVGELGVKREITVIHNGVDTDKFDLEPPQDASHIDEQFMAASSRLLCLSRLDHQKNIFFLIDSFAVAADKIPDKRLFILGTGPLQQAIEARIKLLNLDDRVFLLGFSKKPEDYLKLCDLFVLASRYESFGNVVIEALACGAPVVATNYGTVVNEIMQCDSLGMIVEQGDVNGFAAAMIDITNNRDRYDRNALNEHARTHFNAADKARKYVATVSEAPADQLP
ncbi:MAG: glycosyltransferase [Chloracidobacterium sp.]|nr:glycosyltransferase [Chloracidobacterium sp.]